MCTQLLFAPSFGVVNGSPGSVNMVLAYQIKDHFLTYDRGTVLLIADSVMALALRRLDESPDHVVVGSNELHGCYLHPEEFVDTALEHVFAEGFVDLQSSGVSCFFAAQGVAQPFLSDYFFQRTGVSPLFISGEHIPFEPNSEPWFTRQKLWYVIHATAHAMLR